MLYTLYQGEPSCTYIYIPKCDVLPLDLKGLNIEIRLMSTYICRKRVDIFHNYFRKLPAGININACNGF